MMNWWQGKNENKTINEHSQNVNKLGSMNRWVTEWENHYDYEIHILGQAFV